MGARPFLLILLAFAVRVYTATFNYGIVALDDYSDMLAVSVPGQQERSVRGIIDASYIRSPIPRLCTYSLGKLAYKAGIEDPLNQIRFIYTVLGLISLVSCWACYRIFSEGGREKEGRLCLLLNAVFFILPFLSTRVMIETWSISFMSLSALFATRYWRGDRARDLAMSMLLLSVSSVFRFQAGVCALALGILVLYKRRFRDVLTLAAASVAGFVVTGLADLWMRGEFHQSLFSYIKYNIPNASTYGTSPPLTYTVILLVLALPLVLFLRRVKSFSWRWGYESLAPTALFFLAFLLAHELTPHKEPRYMTPIISLMLVLLTPPLFASWSAEGGKVRFVGAMGLNAVCLFLTSQFPAQNSVISVARFFHRQSSVKNVLSVNESIVPYPSVYSLHNPEIAVVPYADVARLASHSSCDTVIAIRDVFKPGVPAELLGQLHPLARYRPGPLEGLMVWLNPGRNERRGAISLYSPPQCQEALRLSQN